MQHTCQLAPQEGPRRRQTTAPEYTRSIHASWQERERGRQTTATRGIHFNYKKENEDDEAPPRIHTQHTCQLAPQEGQIGRQTTAPEQTRSDTLRRVSFLIEGKGSCRATIPECTRSTYV